MHRTLKPFELLEPESLDEAVASLARWGGDARVLAGGLDLVAKMTRWEMQPDCLVSLDRIPGLDVLERQDDGALRIGPMVTLRGIELSPLVQAGWPLLAAAVDHISSVQVKTMGTLVGNLCVATPASDLAPALLALGATLHIARPDGAAAVPVEDFFVPVCSSILEPGQIVTEVSVPAPAAGTGWAFKKLAHTKACIAKVNVAVTIEREGDVCRRARVALGAVASTPLRVPTAEHALEGCEVDRDLIARAAGLAREAATPITDLRSTADYRRDMVEVLTRRALTEAWDKASEREGRAS